MFKSTSLESLVFDSDVKKLNKKIRFINMAKYLSNDLTTNMVFFSKTKMCTNNEINNCPYKNECKFAHSKEELIDQETLPCLYGPYCIIETCCRKHYNMETTSKIHEYIYEFISDKKKVYKNSAKNNIRNNLNFQKYKTDEGRVLVNKNLILNNDNIKLTNSFDLLD